MHYIGKYLVAHRVTLITEKITYVVNLLTDLITQSYTQTTYINHIKVKM